MRQNKAYNVCQQAESMMHEKTGKIHLLRACVSKSLAREGHGRRWHGGDDDAGGDGDGNHPIEDLASTDCAEKKIRKHRRAKKKLQSPYLPLPVGLPY